MSNRRSYGNDRGGNYGGNSGGGGGRFNSGPSVSPWQSGSIPARNAGPAPLAQKLINNFQMNQPTDSSVAIALLSSILQQSQPPSLMSLNAGNFSGFNNNFPSNNGLRNNHRSSGNRRDDRRNDNYRGNRRPPNDRYKDHKSGDKGRYERPKKSDDDAGIKEASREKKPEPLIKEDPKASVADEDTPQDESKAKDEEMEAEDCDKDKQDQPTSIPGYENVPSKLFHCHVCRKTMWNDVSFDTHIKGRLHRDKLRSLEDSYQMQTDLMRQIASISLRLEEMRRGKRRPYPDQYCKMCDLQFNGMTMFAHRSTDEHQNLKRFIHPTCQLCNVDFQVRLEYDEHILSPGHLQQEAKALLRREKYEKDPQYVNLREQEAKFRLLFDEVANIGTAGSTPELSDEDKKLLATLGEEGQLPAYNPEAENPVARQHITPVEGFLCKVCKVFLLAPETVEIHCKTENHYDAYVAQLKYTAAKQLRDKENADEKRKADDVEENSPKRIKTDGDETKENGDEDDAPAAVPETKDETPAQPVKTGTPARRGRGRGRGGRRGTK